MVEGSASAMGSPNSPLVTAIIPYFNRAHTIVRALRSIERQTYPNIEIIVVDDGSQIAPEQAIADADLSQRVTIIRLDQNRGPSAARNAGIRAANGSFVAFLDSDDEWKDEKISRQMQAVMAAQDPDNVFCTSRTLAIWNDGTQIPTSGWNPDQCSVAEFLFMRDGLLTVDTFVLSRHLALRISFDEELRRFEDILFIVAAKTAGATHIFVDEALSIWYRGWDKNQLTEVPTSSNYGSHFLEAADYMLSNREKLAFAVRVLGPLLARDRPLYFSTSALKALYAGVVSPRGVAGVLYRAYAKQHVRNIAASLFGKA
jgi:glycosyltransferase involved in cell wall biosynthesis